jgi:hypothetical protein
MARQQNTVAKRLREMAKKRKAEDKRVQRRKKNEQINTPPHNPEHPEHANHAEHPPGIEPKPIVPS